MTEPYDHDSRIRRAFPPPDDESVARAWAAVRTARRQPRFGPRLLAAAALLAIGFGAGWLAGTWRQDDRDRAIVSLPNGAVMRVQPPELLFAVTPGALP